MRCLVASKLVLPFAEIMTTQVCNLRCVGCSNYSDLQHQGYLTWAQARTQIEPWLDRIDIPDFGIIGGEPLVNPDIRTWLIGIRELLPNAQIRFTTNGLLLKKHYDIVALLAELGNCVFKITVHTADQEIEEVINNIFADYAWNEVTEFGIKRFKTNNNFRFHVRRPDVFWKTYRGFYNNMLPHNSNPAEAFSICSQTQCPLLFNGALYKCSTAGLLKDTLDKVNSSNLEQWQPYIPEGLLPTCSDSELHSFVNNFGKPHAICGQCPTSKDIDSKVIHATGVTIKKGVA